MEDKAKEYTEKQYYKVDNVDEFNGEPLAVYRAYTQCQEDMADKKYTEEDVIRLMFNATKWDTFKEEEVGYNMTLSQYFNYCLHSLNKKD